MGKDLQVEQLVLPKGCRRVVLQLAHEVRLGGHLGKKNTVQRIANDFTGLPCTGMWLNSVGLVTSARRQQPGRCYRCP